MGMAYYNETNSWPECTWALGVQLVAHWVRASLIRPGVRLLPSRCVCEESRSEGAFTTNTPPLPDLGGRGTWLAILKIRAGIRSHTLPVSRPRSRTSESLNVLFLFMFFVALALNLHPHVPLTPIPTLDLGIFFCCLLPLRHEAALFGSVKTSVVGFVMFCYALYQPW